MMSHYKVKYRVESYDTPHYRFYAAIDAATATEMFKETCQETLVGYNVELLNVVPVEEHNDDIRECSCTSDSCNVDQ
jgi:hypothetical protein